MKELCVPVPNFKDNEVAEVEVKLQNKIIKYNFRVESFPWEIKDEMSNLEHPLEKSLARITRLKNAIESYDKNWELIQIFNPSENSDFIQVLYRKKQ
ncbi:MAG: hypothetical protein JXJ22_12750 [Bacteroidales bacterium]|nr:hypothetical protein [Bacteroidales bacterium]